MALAQVYDPRGHTFESWSALMVEAYAGQQLITGATEDQWQEWGIRVMNVSELEVNSVPNPHLYGNWQDWAQALVSAVNQPTQ
jgi:hypothetical protein